MFTFFVIINLYSYLCDRKADSMEVIFNEIYLRDLYTEAKATRNIVSNLILSENTSVSWI